MCSRTAHRQRRCCHHQDQAIATPHPTFCFPHAEFSSRLSTIPIPLSCLCVPDFNVPWPLLNPDYASDSTPLLARRTVQQDFSFREKNDDHRVKVESHDAALSSSGVNVNGETHTPKATRQASALSQAQESGARRERDGCSLKATRTLRSDLK
jgi:hypothetical protein